MSKGEVIVRFENVSFEYSATKPILQDVSFSIRKGAKLALMGQNGAGKSTLFGLLMGTKHPEDGKIHIGKQVSVAIAQQVIPRHQLDLTLRDFFQSFFAEKVYDIDPKIDEVLEVVQLARTSNIYEKKLSAFSGGQQARILLASALIQEPDLLLLDEPTNNLDAAGIAHLTTFLKEYKKTVVVISHEAEFLNAFTEGVLYLDVYSKKIEQYLGNYHDVVKDISIRIEKENMKNFQLAKEIQAKKDKANEFAYKGGQMRLVAKRMREKAEELEEEIVDVRKEDKTIRPFIIPAQQNLIGDILTLSSYSILKGSKVVTRTASIALRKNKHLLLRGPNGIGKSTLLESIANGKDGSTILPETRVGYYRQDFSTLNFDDTVMEALKKSMKVSGAHYNEERLRAVAANFLITGEYMHTKVGALSEGQKGLVAFASLVLFEPGLLILDEPTNHINFRHLPIIAKAINDYTGALVIVSHVSEFIAQIRIDEILDLEK